MRQLTSRQKTRLDTWIIQYRALSRALYTHEDLDDRDWSELVKINDTEILHQEVDRYISDKNIGALYGK